MKTHKSVTPPEVVTEQVSRALKTSVHTPWIIERVLQKPWSTIYYLTLPAPGESQRIIAKITRTPEQDDFTNSWRSPELVQRGLREHQCLQEVVEHFRSAPRDLQALHPICYIEEINAVITKYVSGQGIWLNALHPRRLLHWHTAGGAEIILHKAGRWLRWLHSIQRSEPSEPRKSRASDSLASLHQHSQQLIEWGVDVRRSNNWQTALDKLETVSSPLSVWLHGDFHPGNLWILPDGRLLCFDTALERHGSPYEDLGKFTAALKSRRTRVLSAGRFPADVIIQRLESAFLDGYHQGEPVNYLSLWLFEGRYLFQKWLEMLAALSQKVPPTSSPIFARVMIHPAFKRMLQSWIERILQQDAEHREEKRSG